MNRQEERFRSAVARLAADPDDFVNAPELSGFLEDIRRELVPTALNIADRFGHPYRGADVDDVVNLLLMAFISSPEKCRYLAENAAAPFKYARTFLSQWLGVETGRRQGQVQVLIDWVEQPDLSLPNSAHDDPAKRFDRDGATIDEAVACTVRVLLPYTPAVLASYLPSIVDWMADNVPTHSGHEKEKLDQAGLAFPLVSMTELQAIGNIVWGGRGRERETSLLGAFLLNKEFTARGSATHRVAVRLYASRVRQPKVLARLAR